MWQIPCNMVEVYWRLRGTCCFSVCKLLPDYMTSHSRRQSSLLSHSEPNRRKHFSELYQLLTWKLLSFGLWCHVVHEITASILQGICWLHFQDRGMQCNLLKSYNTQWRSWSGQVRSSKMVHCHIVYPSTRPDLWIRIHQWLYLSTDLHGGASQKEAVYISTAVENVLSYIILCSLWCVTVSPQYKYSIWSLPHFLRMYYLCLCYDSVLFFDSRGGICTWFSLGWFLDKLD